MESKIGMIDTNWPWDAIRSNAWLRNGVSHFQP